MVAAKLSVLRSDPQGVTEARWQTYEVEMPDGSTVLEALMKIQDEQDGTLAFRRACRHAICGSCAMRINGCAKLACNTQVTLVAEQAAKMATYPGRAAGGATDDDAASSSSPEAAAIRIEPLGNMPVVKDLVTDMDVFWRKLRRTRPWLFPADARPDPDHERLMSPEEWDRMAQGLLCLECGACYSDCNAVEAAPEFIGPTALVKAHRYATDVRDIDEHRRAADLSGDHGLWECMRCYFCSERCPKHIRVRELIAQLGELSWREDLRRDPGARHAAAFVDSLKQSGRLNETTLAVRTQGWSWAVRRAPLAVRVALAGKLTLPPGKIDDHEGLLRVIEAAEQAGQEPGCQPPLQPRREGVEPS
jgi:succinate dehydrogenase / fumarate reductase iron-sulfur subunit